MVRALIFLPLEFPASSYPRRDFIVPYTIHMQEIFATGAGFVLLLGSVGYYVSSRAPSFSCVSFIFFRRRNAFAIFMPG